LLTALECFNNFSVPALGCILIGIFAVVQRLFRALETIPVASEYLSHPRASRTTGSSLRQRVLRGSSELALRSSSVPPVRDCIVACQPLVTKVTCCEITKRIERSVYEAGHATRYERAPIP
jgi:hypothetical protein